MRARLQADLRVAMKAREPERVSVIRSAIAAIGNAEAVRTERSPAQGVVQVEVARRDLSDDDVRAVLEALRTELLDGADELAGLGEEDRAAVVRRQAETLATYLG